jgi:hypothetical protein
MAMGVDEPWGDDEAGNVENFSGGKHIFLGFVRLQDGSNVIIFDDNMCLSQHFDCGRLVVKGEHCAILEYFSAHVEHGRVIEVLILQRN